MIFHYDFPIEFFLTIFLSKAIATVKQILIFHHNSPVEFFLTIFSSEAIATVKQILVFHHNFPIEFFLTIFLSEAIATVKQILILDHSFPIYLPANGIAIASAVDLSQCKINTAAGNSISNGRSSMADTSRGQILDHLRKKNY